MPSAYVTTQPWTLVIKHAPLLLDTCFLLHCMCQDALYLWSCFLHNLALNWPPALSLATCQAPLSHIDEKFPSCPSPAREKIMSSCNCFLCRRQSLLVRQDHSYCSSSTYQAPNTSKVPTVNVFARVETKIKKGPPMSRYNYWLTFLI